MEKSEEFGNDQSSGWHEVKKKHRGTSKFSIHTSAAELSWKNSSGKGGNSHEKHAAQSLKAGTEFPSDAEGVLANNTCTAKQNEDTESFLDKCVVSDDSACQSKQPFRTKTFTSAGSSSFNRNEVSEKKSDVMKMKWGDLDDDDLFFHRENSSASEIKFGEIGDDDFATCRKSESASVLRLSKATRGLINAEDNLLPIKDAASDSHRNLSDCMMEEKCKEVTRASSSYVEVAMTSDEVVDVSVDAPAVAATYNQFLDVTNANLLCNNASVWDKGCEPILTSDLGVAETSSVAATVNSEVGAMMTSRDEVITSNQIAYQTCEESSATVLCVAAKAAPASREAFDGRNLAEECNDSNAERPQEKISKSQIMSALGEIEEGESKERFRERLWCFLFENLNRAVDELYLLCELECDLEQVREAILVLEEAGSDFKELNVRVEEFDKLKRSSTQLADGTLMSMKSDHRRPHALSWEVRRMTTSPHRAEILSSSLEAFKKIQQERAKMHVSGDPNASARHRQSRKPVTIDGLNKLCIPTDTEAKSRKSHSISNPTQASMNKEKKINESSRSSKVNPSRNNRLPSQGSYNYDQSASRAPSRGASAALIGGRSKREQGSSLEMEKSSCSNSELRSQNAVNDEKEKERERRNSLSWKSMNAWKEKRNWEEILASPCRLSSRVSHSPSMSRKSIERARILHDKLLSPEKKKKTALDLKREAEERHARAMRIRSELETERAQKLQKTSEKLTRVNEWQAVRSLKLKEGMDARHQRSESRHVAHIAQVVKRAGDESIKVNELRFITSLNEENKKYMLRQKLHDSELRRAEKLQMLKTKQKEEMAREEAVLERRKILEAEKLQRLAEIQRKKEEAQSRREEERKASSAAREAKAIEQLRRREERAKAQQEEAEMLAQKLAERLGESEQRRKFYLEQIRERASMDLRDHSSPLLRRPLSKEGQGRSTPSSGGEDNLANDASGSGNSHHASSGVGMQQILKRRVKKIRQRLMSLKHDFHEPPLAENCGIGYRTALAAARAKIGRWLQDLQRHRQARKEGASSIGLIIAEMIKFLEGKDVELQAARQSGLLDFISSALPASHISKPEACQVTIYLLRLLKVVLLVPSNRGYFLSQNLLPPIIPMLSAALENYIKIAASLNSPSGSNLPTSRSSVHFDSISEVIDGFLWTVTMIIGHESSDERPVQMQGGLLEIVISYQIIHRLRDLFALYDRPQVEGSPFPSSILLGINFLVALTSRPKTVSTIDWESLPVEEVQINEASLSTISVDANPPDATSALNLKEVEYVSEGGQFGLSCESKRGNYFVSTAADCQKEHDNIITLNPTGGVNPEESKRNASAIIHKCLPLQKDNKKPVDNEGNDEKFLCFKFPQALLISAISETGLVSVLSLLTAVLLQANSRSSEQPSYVLPSNFVEVATGVLKVLSNLALLDLTFMQQMLARPDLKMEFFHIMSFLLTHCTSHWKVPSDQIGLLLLESLNLLGYFSLFHPENQAVLRWGKGPTILHKVCDLPFVFFSDPELMPVLAGVLVAACFGCKQNKGVVQQELSIEMLLSLVNSCKNSSQDDYSNQPNPDSLKLQQSELAKTCRATFRSGTRPPLVKGSAPASGSMNRGNRVRNNKEIRVGAKALDEVGSRHKIAVAAANEPVPGLMLHSRFPVSFIDQVEKFFAMETS